MADAQAPIDWTKLLELLSQLAPLLPVLLPLLQSLIKKSEYARTHNLPDPLQTLGVFLSDYDITRKAMAANP